MKLTVTDEFLWDLYKLYEKVDDFLFIFSPKTLKEAAAPSCLSVRRIYEKKKQHWAFSRLIWYLKKKGYIKIKSLEPNEGMVLTSKGAGKILKISLRQLERRKRKDGKWIMVVFDIPEKLRRSRDFLRQILQSLGFKFLQKSIWVCPYDVLEKLQKIIQKINLEKYVKIFLIQEIEV